MPKFGLKSQKLNEILRFENFEITRFFPFVDIIIIIIIIIIGLFLK